MPKQVYNRFVVPTRRGRKTGVGILVVVLSATVGYRMRSYGPKMLFKTDEGSTLMEKIIDSVLLRFNGADLVFTIGFQADRIIRNKPPVGRLVENQLYETTNSIEECRLAINNSDCESVLLISGDLYYESHLLDLIDTNFSSVITDNNGSMEEDDIGVTVVDNKASIFSYGLPTKWSYITYLRGKEFSLFNSFCQNRENSKKFVWEGLNHVADNGGNIRAIDNKQAKITRMMA
jgi:hypothetical protein